MDLAKQEKKAAQAGAKGRGLPHPRRSTENYWQS
jgi:hypothetical protein